MVEEFDRGPSGGRKPQEKDSDGGLQAGERDAAPQERPGPEAGAAPATPAAGPEGGSGPSGSPPAPDPLSEAEARIAVLEAELRAKTEEAARNFDLYLRECAEADNFRKRLQREKAEAIRFGNEALVREILPLLDNLELAVEHAELGGNGKSVVEGIRMIVRMFRDVLERNGVRAIEVAPGSPFDSTVHEAVDAEASSEHPPNTVIRQELKGYEMHGRLIRPARVVVATAPRAETAGPGEDGGE